LDCRVRRTDHAAPVRELVLEIDNVLFDLFDGVQCGRLFVIHRVQEVGSERHDPISDTQEAFLVVLGIGDLVLDQLESGSFAKSRVGRRQSLLIQ
jgi:hypothetical protein